MENINQVERQTFQVLGAQPVQAPYSTYVEFKQLFEQALQECLQYTNNKPINQFLRLADSDTVECYLLDEPDHLPDAIYDQFDSIFHRNHLLSNGIDWWWNRLASELEIEWDVE